MPTRGDEPCVFIMKCDFELPEEGRVEEWELKIHQFSHARYFENFLSRHKWPDEGHEERQ